MPLPFSQTLSHPAAPVKITQEKAIVVKYGCINLYNVLQAPTIFQANF